ncbi:SOS response-associated peptidase family protein [Oceanihabitans sp. 2_MG-2023]|uniref:SOS response-associated peptidase family protein n=1 Tax=Oceanihabitans sp. 2_MG-2023 TaxID=3062661 RepID=UPI0026E211FC|nr:SOS response-associated peptidase family protein [Oceanihabitans sp. 2_MG-2023]MDO6598148.1 SOS response-associated peptidase family protein [Oceanihabitans sp. 2_MG-2023]
MFYKLRNTASLKTIEDTFEAQFKYPKLYKPIPIINGLKESTLPIITIEKTKTIDFSIWGLLPVDFKDNWAVFQNISNTLNVPVNNVTNEDVFYTKSLKTKRCLIVVNGFYTTFISAGKIKTFLVYRKNNKPFCMAGVYNELSDGFKTCSLLMMPTKNNSIPNFSKNQPVILKRKYFNYWLDKSYSFSEVKAIINNRDYYDFQSKVVNQEIIQSSELTS